MSSRVEHFRSGANADSLGQTLLHGTKSGCYKTLDGGVFTPVLKQAIWIDIIQIKQ